MSFEYNGKTYETAGTGLASTRTTGARTWPKADGAGRGPPLTQEHWDFIDYLRDMYLNHNGKQPNIVRSSEGHAGKVAARTSARKTVRPIPQGPPKQAGQIAGLPERAEGRILKGAGCEVEARGRNDYLFLSPLVSCAP